MRKKIKKKVAKNFEIENLAKKNILKKMPEKFVNLHTHSFFSILESSASPKKICEKAKKMNCPAVALTDTGAGFGLLDFYKNAKKIGVQPILGAEIFVARDSRFERRHGIDGREGNLVLLAKNKIGFENLLKIISIANLEGNFFHPRVDEEILRKFSDGLFVLSGSTTGEINKLWQNFGKKKAENFFKKICEIFGTENFFAEIVARNQPAQKKIK